MYKAENIMSFHKNMKKRLTLKIRSQQKHNHNHSQELIYPGQVLMAHACNPSYSGGRDQEDQGSKPA
jgi:hypothetical protein